MKHPYLSGQTAATIARSLEIAINNGLLREGDRIPSVRDAASILDVNRNTVATAYAKLRDAGVLTGAGGRSGMRIARTEPFEGRSVAVPGGMRDLASGNVDVDFLPRLEPLLQQMDFSPTGYDAEGDDARLVDLARHKLALEGLDTRNMCFLSGALDAIERIMRAEIRAGSTILVEDPGFPPLFDLLRSLGMKLKAIPVDDHGPDPDSLDRGLASGAAAAVIVPRAQNPFGA